LLGFGLPVLSQSLKKLAAAEIGVEAKDQDVLIQYPHSFSLSAILPQIKLEIGPLSAPLLRFVPAEPLANSRYGTGTA